MSISKLQTINFLYFPAILLSHFRKGKIVSIDGMKCFSIDHIFLKFVHLSIQPLIMDGGSAMHLA